MTDFNMGRRSGRFRRAQGGSSAALSPRLLNGASIGVLALAFAGAMSGEALAQASAAATADAASPGQVDEVVVTASRIVRDGYTAPTPTTVLGVEEIQRAAKVNIADQVNQLPALAGSFRNNTNSVSGGGIGVNALNLRNLGVTRTLILLDGQRMPVATTFGVVDVNTIPGSLIKRVDIVTGGASAAWGSEAVAGVVNFVLDKEYTGIKGDLAAGTTTYGDDANVKGSLSIGKSFAGDRGHILLSGEVAYNDGIRGMPRNWYRGTKQLFNPAYTPTNGQPQLIVRENVGYTTTAPGAIVTTGPLRGLYFGPNGVPSQLNYGSIVSDPAMVGGDWQYTDFATRTESFAPTVSRQSAFARVSYEVASDVELFAQFAYSRSNIETLSSPEYRFGGLTIARDNAFLPASVVARMQQLNVTSLTVGSWNEGLGPVPFESDRQLYRYAVGANGAIGLFGKQWNWDAFVNRNISDIRQVASVSINANYSRAIDAVVGPNGSIVCRSTLTDPTNGCVPLNILGTGVVSPAAAAWVRGQPTLNNRFTQDEFAASMRGEPLSSWAGPVSVALGVGHRKEQSNGTSDALSLTNRYFFGNYKPIKGSYDVTEGFFETVVPLAKDLPWAQALDLNAAVRVTDYSSSGVVTTWKVGAVWTPIEDIKFRATRSRDIRAGNLADLFQPGATRTITVNDPRLNNQSYTIVTSTVGNETISPEKADSFNIGAVLQPRSLPGFSAAIDYWSVDVVDAIATLSAQNLLNLCFVGGNTSLCPFVARNAAGFITEVTLKPINLASQEARGIDLEASYSLPLDALSPDGRLTLRALATHYIRNTTNSGILGSIPTSSIGSYGAFDRGTPRWRYRLEASYSDGPFSGSLSAWGISSGVLLASNIECTSGCPTSTTNNRTIDNNHVDGALYFDASISYKFTSGLEGFVVVDNLLNTDPPQVADGTSVFGAQWGTSATYYDLFGRTFRAGIRFKY
ncbi:MAG: TonB-dependent receptor plug domain-containing protein [Actinomycetota bacterium]